MDSNLIEPLILRFISSRITSGAENQYNQPEFKQDFDLTDLKLQQKGP
jgi:hypothetical protein